ncbi:restriction endonuclease S subunit [Paenibacillus anaericanus]|uniref:hypothetical protein n=1 Tax=Paenibacillus anaericanus TaxID=170367 RepID=UPI002784C2F5|nr:hypothetical protein [Paenibacillus anaericanus]MDQ0086730.1 restriction endonuclease S subunit [Paenibacillus anaericanus]
MLLDQCAVVSQGANLSRVQILPSSDSVRLSLYTMKEMNESSNSEKTQEIDVLKEKLTGLPIAIEGMVVMNLIAHRASTIHNNHTGKLIPSNFAIIELNEMVDSAYMEWYINEHPNCLKQLRIATQGSSVAALSIQMLRTLEIELPSLSQQRLIGSIYRSLHLKKRLLNERIELEQTLVEHILLQSLKGDTT